MLRTKNKLDVLHFNGITAPGAPTISLVAGGNLTEASVYGIRVTFYDSSTGRESVQSDASGTVTATSTNKAIVVSDLPVSSDSEVDSRRIYMSVDGGAYTLHSTVDDNTTSAVTVTTTTIDFSGDGTGFTESGSDTDFSGASAAIAASSTPSGEMIYASFTSDLNAERSLGDSTGTSGSVTISGGKADMTGNVNGELIAFAVSAGDIMPQNIGTIEVFFTPDFTGAPAEDAYICEYARAAGGGANNLKLYYNTSEEWRFIAVNEGGFQILSLTISDPGRMVDGTEIFVSMNFDFTNGAHRLFVGTPGSTASQVGTTDTTTAIPNPRGTSAVDQLNIGNARPPLGTSDPDFFIRHFQVSNVVKRTASFTAPSVGLLYPEAPAKIAYDTTINAVGIKSVTGTVTTPGSSAVGYTLGYDGTEYYYNSGWVAANGTDQYNSEADINTNAATFPITAVDKDVTVYTYLDSVSGVDQPTITALVVEAYPDGAIDEEVASSTTPPTTETSNAFTDVSQSAMSYLRDTFTVTLSSTADYLYVGYYKPIHAVYLAFSTANTNAGTLTGQFYNGTTWVDLVGLMDETKSFTRDGFIQWDANQTDEAKTTINSTERYWYRFMPSASHSATTALGLNIVFADDTDLKAELFEILDTQYLPSGQTSHILSHVAARDEIIQFIRNSGRYKESLSNGNIKDISVFDLLDLGQIKLAATYLALSKIMLNISDDVDDIFMQKSNEYRRKYKEAIATWYLDLDYDDDGKLDEEERLAENTSRLVRR